MSAETGIVEIAATETKAWVDKGEALLIDVRESGEFGQEHMPDAVLAPLATFDARRLPSPEGKKVVLVCKSGRRSSLAARKMIEAGYPVAYTLKGGILAWKAARLPVIH